MPSFIHPTATIDEPVTIGVNTKIWHYTHIMSEAIIGTNCNIGQNVFIASGVVLGNNVKVQNNVSLYAGITCGDDVFLGPSMVFTNVKNPRSAVNRRGQYEKTHVGKGATIGANATIVCGNDIGLIGNPGQQIGWMSQFGHRLNFDENGKATCSESKQNYILKEGSVSKV